MLPTFLAAVAVYVVGAHVYARWQRRSQLLVLLGHAAPTVVACEMAWCFVVRRGETVVQFAVGDSEVMALWSLWVRTWPMFLLALCASGAVHTMATLFVACDAKTRRWLPLTLGGAILSAFGLAVVFEWAPTA